MENSVIRVFPVLIVSSGVVGVFKDLVAEILKSSKAPARCVVTKFLSASVLKQFSPRSKAYIYVYEDVRWFLVDLLMMCSEINIYGMDRFIYKFLRSSAGIIPVSMRRLSEIKVGSGDILYLYAIEKSGEERRLVAVRIDIVAGSGE